MPEYVVTAVGADRPGIVAAITDALLAVGGNLADVRAALLRGSFAVVLAVEVPDDVEAAGLERALAPTAEDLGLILSVGEATRPVEGVAGEGCMVSVYGADRPGIVQGITTALAEKGVNVVDLSSRLVGDPPLYVLGIRVELPPGLDAEGLVAHLEPVARSRGVELAVNPVGDTLL